MRTVKIGRRGMVQVQQRTNIYVPECRTATEGSMKKKGNGYRVVVDGWGGIDYNPHNGMQVAEKYVKTEWWSGRAKTQTILPMETWEEGGSEGEGEGEGE